MTLVEGPRISIVDRVYARAIALAVRGGSDAAAFELISAASGSPHVLGRVCDRLRTLVVENPNAHGPAAALVIANDARFRALAAG
jgi:hypothetical protein